MAQNLRRLNLLAGLLHLGQGIGILLLSTDFSLPVTAAFLEFNQTAGKLEARQDSLFQLELGPLVAGFLLLSSIAHFVISSPIMFPKYVKDLHRGINYARWIEYSISASLMIVVIAMLVGIYDVASLILIFTLNVCMILFGMVMEFHNQRTDQTNWLPFWFGTLAGIVPWVAIFLYLIGAGMGEGGPPGFVYGIFVSLFLFFNVFAVNMVLQYKKVGPWREYIYGERVYILLSFTAKSALAWQAFAGTLRPV
ncbi:MAG: hypothetical protein FJ320_08575 [SAR202 cluster bacterium]|nr:hypothetical protein [SAR202 cluster bacterium]